MIRLREESVLAAEPDEIWAVYTNIASHYRALHPGHLDWRWLEGLPLRPGAAWFADEWVGPLRISARFVVTHAEPGRFFTYRLGFPHTLVRAAGEIRVSPHDSAGSVLSAEVRIGWTTPLLGPVADRVLARVLPLEALRRHLRQEQAGLAALLAS